MNAPYRGLTWDHPRGFQALRAAAARANGLIEWTTQPLEGFEAAPIAGLCANYDLVVLDHPHLGEAVATQCLQPLDAVLPAADLARIEAASVGPSYASYTVGDRQWALPLDAASQVMATRADLLVQPAPQTWGEVIVWAEHNSGLALSLAGPHALLSFLSIAAAIDPDCDLRDGARWLEPAVAAQAWDILAALYQHVLPTTTELNPIGLLAAMTSTDDIVLCPLVYGYVNYAATELDRPLTFANAPASQHGGQPGSIIGGTGIAVSRRCDVSTTLREHLLWLLDEATQSSFIPPQAGQPSSTASWLDPAVNISCNGFYQNTLSTLQHASLRPRHDGFIRFQGRASAWLREALCQGHAASRVVTTLATFFHDSHTNRTAQ